MTEIDNIFLLDLDQMPENFIKITSLFTKVSRTYAIDGCPLFFKIENSTNKHSRFSCGSNERLSIYQKVSQEFKDNCCQKLIEITGIDIELANKILLINNYNLETSINCVVTNEYSQLISLIDNHWTIVNKIISQENNEILIATFYNHYNYTRGLIELLKNIDVKNNFKLYITHENIENHNRFRMYINVYINGIYLNNIYDVAKIPLFLFRIICDQTVQSQFTININEIREIKNNNTLKKKFKRDFFKYQISNINWMIEIENLIQNNNLCFSTFINDTSSDIFKIESINEYLICDRNGDMKNPELLPQINIKPKGGILCDDIGLGKTFSFIGLIYETLHTNNTPSLVICPTRLCKQWMEEINISVSLKTTIISTISQFKKYIKDKSKNVDYDVVILSYNFLTNKNYNKYKEENPKENNNFIENINWYRIILDEGHEYFDSLKVKRVYYKETKQMLDNLQCKYKWICSGTPYNNMESFLNMCKYICEIDSKDNLTTITNFEQLKHISQKIVDSIFRKNTKESVKHQVIIPEPIITTDFLDQSEIEKAIYNSALGDKNKMIQLCSHILVSDEHIYILGNKPLPFDEIQQRMVDYYSSKINNLDKNIKGIKEKNSNYHERVLKLENKITNTIDNVPNKEGNKIEENKIIEINLKTEENNIKLEEYNRQLKENTSKFKIFTDLHKKMKDNNECPICFNDLQTNIKVVLQCGHFFCSTCISKVLNTKTSESCPYCRNKFLKSDLQIIEPNKDIINEVNKWGTKMSYLINYLNKILINSNNRIIIFSQWDNLLKLVGNVLNEKDIPHLFLNGSIHVINGRIRRFKLDPSIRIVLLSSDKAVSGLTLTEANHIILLDTLNNDKESSQIIEEQAIGRAVRIGQNKRVNVKRLIMSETIEHDFYLQNIENKKIKI